MKTNKTYILKYVKYYNFINLFSNSTFIILILEKVSLTQSSMLLESTTIPKLF
jgi:hypothetical protein